MKLPLTILLALFSLVLFYPKAQGQTFSASKQGRSERLNVTLRINPDSSVNFQLDQDENGLYVEYLGRITQKSDSTYRIQAIITLGQFYCKGWGWDTILIQLDPEIAQELHKITLTFANGQFTRLSGSDRLGKSKRLLRIPYQKKWFNRRKGSDFYTLSIPRKNPITGEPLVFKIYFGSAPTFTSGQKIDFEVQIQDHQLWTLHPPPLQSGPFKLQQNQPRL